jgi:hypothetical protein
MVDKSLARIQRWMLAVIQQPDGAMADSRVLYVIRPSRKMSSRDRLQIYANAYFARLLEVLTGEFPAVVHAVGTDVFAEFAAGYLHRHPSTSYTLSQLGAKFPEHLAETRPPRDTEGPDWADFLIDLATLERCYSEVFDGPGTEGASSFDLHGVAAEQWPECRLVFAPCVRLIRLRFPVHEYITAVRHGQQPIPPTAAETHLVVSRREFIVRRVAVSADEFRLLSALFSGATVGDAIAQWFAETPTASPPIREWFERWTAAGYFAAVVTNAPE